ncbi:MAG: glycine--tRNA ligase subunit alpha [Acidobacteriota bacterium]
MASLEQVIGRLSEFWRERGCVPVASSGLPLPVGLMHPRAFFGLLGTGPWRAAWLQPVHRPMDVRHGRHPFRTGRHLQFQVVLREPPAGEVRGWYLDSFAHLGLDRSVRDFRLLDLKWGLASLGASGRGWRLKVDGLGVGRLIFLETLGGQTLDPPPVEISYGVEYVAMARDAAASDGDVFTLPWRNDGEVVGPGYDPLRRLEEEELSRYAAEVAGVDHLRRTFEGLVAEARRCLDAGLAGPAYELAVQAVPMLDLLSVRGELQAQGRAAGLAEVRGLVGGAASLFRTGQGSPPKPKPETRATPDPGTGDSDGE